MKGTLLEFLCSDPSDHLDAKEDYKLSLYYETCKFSEHGRLALSFCRYGDLSHLDDVVVRCLP